MTLTDTQRAILVEASRRADRLAAPPERLPAAALEAVARALLRQGLVRDERASAYDARDLWRIDGRGRLLRLTNEGLRAIGIEPNENDGAPVEGVPLSNIAPAGGEDAPEQDCPREDVEPAHATPARAPRASLREAAAAVLAAWENEANRAGDMIAALDAPMEALRALLAEQPARAVREPGAPRKPRAGTKQEAVLALLRRAEGATIAQIIEATGWAPHTVRGFLAGLKKRQGIEVQVLERVRQVGPNKEGAKGSYSIYHLPA